ncbi:hypothetical protein AWB69_08715 [Caballeronia udeis]|uniref:Uncharacterized protein n=1 Tax=Caballeronia udeis TaxID=1232866 RepID=A0A158JTX1_9BURK|nr:hypothetical protein AWB69_08715 [Caballeronia udeis]
MPLPANSVQVAPLLVEYHHVPAVVFAAVIATPIAPGGVPSWALAPSGSVTLPLPVSADTSVPTAPTGAPASSVAWLSVTGTPLSSGESLVGTTSMVATAAVVVALVVLSTTEIVTSRTVVFGVSLLS